MALIDKIAWLHLSSGTILAVRSSGKDRFYLPGGKREPGEGDMEALLREIAEELSVEIIPKTVSHFETFQDQADGKSEGVVVKMTCYTGDYRGTLAPNSEIADMAWLTYGDRPRVSPVVQKIFDRLRERNLL